MVSHCRAKQSGQVDDHGDRLSNLRQSECSDIAEGSNHSCWRDGAKMLTLRSRGMLESVGRIRLDDDLGVEFSQSARQGHDLDDGRCSCEYALGGDDDGRVEVAGLASLGRPRSRLTM